jgi:hypothetical protein
MYRFSLIDAALVEVTVIFRANEPPASKPFGASWRCNCGVSIGHCSGTRHKIFSAYLANSVSIHVNKRDCTCRPIQRSTAASRAIHRCAHDYWLAAFYCFSSPGIHHRKYGVGTACNLVTPRKRRHIRQRNSCCSTSVKPLSAMRRCFFT